MPVNAKRLWTPRNTIAHFRAWTHQPEIRHYVPSPPPRLLHKQTPTVMDEDVKGRLMAELAAWDAQIAQIESECALDPTTLKDRLAALMHTQDVLKFGDSDGNLTIGEFRMHMRSLGLRNKAVSNEEIDALFNEWDDDGSGGIDLPELEAGLLGVKRHWEVTEGKRGELRLKRQGQLDQLHKLVRAARDAIKAQEAVEEAEEELRELTEHISSRLDIQLGGLLARRGIKAGELVGSWQGPRPLPRPGRPKHGGGGGANRRAAATRTALFSKDVGDGSTELTRGEFASGVKGLGLLIGPEQQPPSTSALGKLFDSVDADGSGSLDVREAAGALKRWASEGKQSYATKANKQREVSMLKGKASRALQEALRPPEPVQAVNFSGSGHAQTTLGGGGGGGGDSPDEGMGESAGGSRMLGMLSPFVSEERRLQRERAEERKKEAAARARQAIRFMRARHLANGFRTWAEHHENQMWQLRQVRLGIGRLLFREEGRAWLTWQSYIAASWRQRHLLRTTLHSLVGSELMRGWRSWLCYLDDQQKQRRIVGVATSAIASLKGTPHLVSSFAWWRHEQRRLALARGDLALAGLSLPARLCHALGLRCMP